MVRVHQPPGGQTHVNDDLPPEHLNVRVQQPPGGKTHFDDEVIPQLPKVRVLKPPGGGSSISFGEEDNFSHMKAKAAPQEEAPKNDVQDESPKAETNGTNGTNGTTTPPQTPKDNATATKENNPSPATNGIAVNGSVSNGTNGTTPSGSSTPNSSRIDTQSRLFGEEPRQEVASRRVRDHHRSNIFSGDDEKVNTPKAANPAGNETPEAKTPDQAQPLPQPQPQSQQKQRIPPGGFSTKLW